MTGRLHLFTYGSLMFLPVWQRVVQGSYESRLATLKQHQRFALQGESYPAVVARAAQQVQGRVYFDVQPADIARLDTFEGDAYQRVFGEVTLLDDSETLQQVTPVSFYLFLAQDKLSRTDWDPVYFERVGMEAFLATYCVDKGV
jgi:gamma-glutamylcyclotransferase (GGCT)/AIG2-like uncharacterized protein YtfP